MKRILIANRGEIALRIMKTCRVMGIETVAVASPADREAPHVRFADDHRVIGATPAVESYLRGDLVIAAATESGADGIHPGYGFLSENAAFARDVAAAGLTFIGPGPEVIAAMGSKMESKRLMAEAGVPVVPGYDGASQDAKILAAEAEKIGFPLLIKASAGGGGKGMRIVTRPEDFAGALTAAKREGQAAFGDDAVLLERYLEKPRHVEFQVFGDQHGQVVHLYERECSIQRRYQKIVEETPSPALDEKTRTAMAQAAVRAAETVGYTNAGTVEFILDASGAFFFLEMNTRLQVEHPITEMLTGLDLVRWQIAVARGERLPLKQGAIQRQGHAIEVRLYAEDPANGFLPQTGRVVAYEEPRGLNLRVDSGIALGSEVSIHYDPMVAKVIARGADREEARLNLRHGLLNGCIHGVKTNQAFLLAVLDHPEFIAGRTDTGFLARHFPEFAADETNLDTALLLAAASAGGERGPSTVQGDRPRFEDPWRQLTGWRLTP